MSAPEGGGKGGKADTLPGRRGEGGQWQKADVLKFGNSTKIFNF